MRICSKIVLLASVFFVAGCTASQAVLPDFNATNVLIQGISPAELPGIKPVVLNSTLPLVTQPPRVLQITVPPFSTMLYGTLAIVGCGLVSYGIACLFLSRLGIVMKDKRIPSFGWLPHPLQLQDNGSSVTKPPKKDTPESLAMCCCIEGRKNESFVIPKTCNLSLTKPTVTSLVVQKKAFEDHVFDWSSEQIRVVGVCDGHGEPYLFNETCDHRRKHRISKCAGYLPCIIGSLLPVCLDKALSCLDKPDDKKIQETIKTVFINFNKEKVKSCYEAMGTLVDHPLWHNFVLTRKNSFGFGGSTCVLGILMPGKNGEEDKFAIAHVGDSRAVVVFNGDRDVWQTTDHVGDNKAEEMRVKAAGGSIIAVGPVKRLGGNLMLTRSFGDFAFADKGLIAEPDVQIFKKSEIKFVLLCSDGFIDALDRKRKLGLSPQMHDNTALLCDLVCELQKNDCYKQAPSQKINDNCFFSAYADDDATYQLIVP